MTVAISGNGTFTGTSLVANNISSTSKLAVGNMATGSVLQVVQAQSTTTITTTTTTYADLMSASITPISISSKIFVIWSMGVFTTAGAIPELQLLRNSTSIYVNGFWQHIKIGRAHV